jgi:L-threonylcarbamoyladenylate synthase
MLEELAVLDDKARKLIAKFTPGPITILVTKKRNVPDILTSASMEIGIRIPNHSFALRLIEKSGPIVSTSANIHSKPNPTDAETAIRDIGSKVDVCVDCGPCKVGKPSTSIQLSEGGVEIIRHGAIPDKDIEEALNE